MARTREKRVVMDQRTPRQMDAAARGAQAGRALAADEWAAGVTDPRGEEDLFGAFWFYQPGEPVPDPFVAFVEARAAMNGYVQQWTDLDGGRRGEYLRWAADHGFLREDVGVSDVLRALLAEREGQER